MKKLDKLTFVATRYPDHELLSELGLLDDVNAIFDTMGLKDFLTLGCDTYVDLTKQFLATLTVKNFLSEERWDEDVEINFKINGVAYSMDAYELKCAYGLPRGRNRTMNISSYAADMVWNTIGVGEYKKSLTKSSNIRHPAIRYVHKVLAHTFFARRETGSITTDEMIYMTVGLAPFLAHFRDGRGLHASSYDVSLVSAFVHFLQYVQDWTINTTDKTPQVSMGGLLTPIFLARNIALVGKRLPLAKVDKFYLTRTKFLVGSLGSSYVYRFQSTANDMQKIILPQPELTSLRVAANIAFNHGEEHWYNKSRHGEIQKIIVPKVPLPRASIPQRTEEAPSSSRPQSTPVHGSARYNFTPYDEPILQPALRQAHEHIHLLQRFIKWQGRSLKKVVNQVKSLKGEVKQLKKKFSDASCSNPQPDEVVDSAAAQPASAEDEDMAERHSSQETHQPPRSSSHERRQRRKRRATRSPTPPVPSSSNSSYSFSSTSWQ